MIRVCARILQDAFCVLTIVRQRLDLVRSSAMPFVAPFDSRRRKAAAESFRRIDVKTS
jgi:hypothetical protein